jgi:multidrug resistance efflux pump
MILKYVVPALALAMLGFAMLHVVRSQEERRTDESLSPPEQPFEQTLAATGIVEARTTNIAVASPLPGVAVRVLVRAGQQVAANQPLLILDDRSLRAELLVRRARLATARAERERLEHLPRPEELPPSAAGIRAARALLRQRLLHLTQGKELFKKSLIPPDELDQRQVMKDVAQEQLARAEAEDRLLQAGASDPDKAIARARIAEAEAMVEQVRTELDRLTVRAPVSGTVLQVNVRAGESVGVRPEPPPVILGETHLLHVRVDLDEQQIARFRPDAPAVATRRGAPKLTFSLHFVRVEPLVVIKSALTGDIRERTDARVLQVIYALELGGEKIYVGQQMDVFIENTHP